MSLMLILCTASLLKFSLVNLIGGAVFGTGIGFVPAYTTFMEISSNCSLYTSAGACSSVLHTSCLWIPPPLANHTGSCTFIGVDCSGFAVESDCEADGSSSCFYDHSAKMCKHVAGYTPLHNGIFAGAMIFGCLIGCAVGGAAVRRFQTRGAMLGMSGIALFACLLIHISALENIFALLIIGRIIYGIACGIGCVTCPMYTDQHAPANLRSTIGSFFQIAITFSIALIAGFGLALNPTDAALGAPSGPDMKLRFQLYVALPTVMVLLLLLVAYFVDNIPTDVTLQHGIMIFDKPLNVNDQLTSGGGGGRDVPLGSKTDKRRNVESPWATSAPTASGLLDGGSGKDNKYDESLGGDADDGFHRKSYSFSEMRDPLLAGAIMACAAQMTGINAIMNFAPSITKSMHIAPLLGNFILMVWNFATTVAAIPIVARVPVKRMFLTGTLLISVSCLCLGIPVYPGVASSGVKQGLSIFGIVALVGVFEMGLGPPFWILTQQLFPTSFRSRGASITTVVLQFFNIVMNVCFPLAVEGLSGGPSGDQDKGMAITFMIFGSIGIVCWLLLLRMLKPWEERLFAAS